ncbi:type I-C CRISPR-associated endonuclease Cas1c [Cloacibacillus evryensis]|uniref:CRISPR-associated endonuclease Cas1 n=1 Tax=Cloacibacillus evryensis TaxID=508460 RepID=A0AAW5K7J0_9BACT|nr:type I-C CRISPR-associated endonuclease Cas1c [Cloacibacillus evryensis]EHL70097.1 CRISPR-associated endonuclease cas1, subtype I-c/dvulg [Synergistes sp. 3_1_syn1]MCQ4815104.1 type I-C CRISPR-associated endonuclease Cas1c [Cloacibacillus evryensis]
MKRLLNSLFVMTQGTWLSLKGENIIVHADGSEKKALPIHIFESILCFGQVNVTPPLMGCCAEHGVPISFFTEYGKFIARVQGPVHGNVLLRREQYRIADDESKSLPLVRNILLGKLANTKIVLQRFLRDHPQPEKTAACFRGAISLTESYIAQLDAAKTVDEMRGYEGTVARIYFDLFDGMILHQKDYFRFTDRNRRPPLDAVNAMLSYLYSLLAHDVTSALEGVGLDPAVGFLHKDRPGRPSLALDMMEEFRTWWADRLVLSMINMKQAKPGGFTQSESGAVLMDDAMRKAIIGEWQSRKQDEIIHPYTGEKIAIGMLPHMQAMLLARYIRGDLKEYPPFVWK